MSDAVELNTTAPERVEKETVGLSNSVPGSDFKDPWEVDGVVQPTVSKASAPQLDTAIPLATVPKIV